MFRISLASCRAAALAGFAFCGAAHAGSFTVVDDRAPVEVSEVSRLYIDGNLAATFRLDPNTPTQSRVVQTPMGRVNHDYALCGEITIQTPDGRHETHQVSSEGILNHPDGHTLQAIGAADFTDFYLTDPDDPTIAEHHPGRSGACISPSV
ncbi:hypothetical protein [Tanticharoenia sakaeratensis]|jgi:hypothetical protein|uniref:Uncharacterized protein n=1 Tax=Tanticharoenia sakaeratensis NBRC 103193 TaxID=1231623 RepID=A0A0D6MMR4_9PROT|nr:hypothetical protein [Tanticharoenia sakaeratensis]GAN54959.1 hypothetical protein Tasa_034_043 [Tanticharoenia sakaeratensis NBRC 103193]GBQ22574.1 hypothetical protein AA103193_2118 [Tanticharoenia sakaeratensis NBRC 103193]